jgi:hypothetical protein
MIDATKIRERMPVISADERAIGFVSRVSSTELRMTRVKDGRGFDHLIPIECVEEVGKYVFLNKSRRYVASHSETANPRPGSRRQAA